MREQCKGCLYFCDTPMLIGPHCNHIKSAIVPEWWEVHPDGECPEYTDKEKWAKMALINTAESGVFASDRSIQDYSDRIWHARPIKWD